MRKEFKKLVVVLMAAIVVGLSTSAQGKSSGGSSGCAGGSTINVTTLIADTDSNSLPFQFQSDGGGAYVPSRTVSSEIQGTTCDWVLNLGSNTPTRAVTFTFLYPASNGATAPFVGPEKVVANVESVCGNNPLNNGISFGTMTYAGQTLQCPFHAVFGYSGSTYEVTMNPNKYAGSTWVQATCTGAASSLCNSWTVSPVPNSGVNSSTGQPSAIGEVYLLTSSKGKQTITPMGLYYVALGVSITKP